jgi:hypothetical protein
MVLSNIYDNVIKHNKMIQIQPVTVTKTGNEFSLKLMFDDLSTTAQFTYYVINDSGEWIQHGDLSMTGTDYTNWNGSNTGAYDWALNELGFTRQG